MFFEPVHFVENLIYLLKGVSGTFAVIGVIALSTLILNKGYKNGK